MAADYSLSIADAGPPWVVSLGDLAGDIFALIGSTVELVVRPVDGGDPVIFTSEIAITQAGNQVVYTPDIEDWVTLGPGLYLAQFKAIAATAAGPTTFPSPSPALVEVTP